MQTVLMLIQLGTFVLIALGAWLSLTTSTRTKPDAPSTPPKKDVTASIS